MTMLRIENVVYLDEKTFFEDLKYINESESLIKTISKVLEDIKSTNDNNKKEYLSMYIENLLEEELR